MVQIVVTSYNIQKLVMVNKKEFINKNMIHQEYVYYNVIAFINFIIKLHHMVILVFHIIIVHLFHHIVNL